MAGSHIPLTSQLVCVGCCYFHTGDLPFSAAPRGTGVTLTVHSQPLPQARLCASASCASSTAPVDTPINHAIYKRADQDHVPQLEEQV